MNTWTAVYERDGSGWNATIEGLPDGCVCFTYGRTMDETRDRIRESLACGLEDANAAATATILDVGLTL